MVDDQAHPYELRMRVLGAPRGKVWRCWTEPELLERWFAPPSWTMEVRALQPRPGGASHIVMRGPDGQVSDGISVFLEADAPRRLVFTNAFISAWTPASRPAVVPFVTTVVEMSARG